MSVFDFYKRKTNFNTYDNNYNGNKNNTLGAELKRESDNVMDLTWWNDPQSKVAYVYDYYHDDQRHMNVGMTYENTTKTQIDIKFIVSEYGSFSKDQPTAKIMFRPSMKNTFNINDDLYYLQQRAERYEMDNPWIGVYIDIPDEHGVYHKWMIIVQDIQGNQFQKYLVLPCNYELCWIYRNKGQRIKQKMWCVLRSQNSYNAGSTWFALLEIIRATLF